MFYQKENYKNLITIKEYYTREKSIRTSVLQFETILNESLQFTNKVEKKDYLQFFDYLDCYMYFDKENRYASFSNNWLREKFGRPVINGKQKYKLDIMIKNLIDAKIIDQTSYSNYNKNKSYTRSYYYTDEFLDKVINRDIEFTISSDEGYNKISKNYIRPELSYHQDQYDILNSDRFKVNLEKAGEWLIQQYNNKELSKHTTFLNFRIICALNDKRTFFTISEKTNRVFTGFAFLKKELRQFCSIDDEQISSLDLKSSQPLIFATMLLNEYPDNLDIQSFYYLITKEDVYEWLQEEWSKENSYYIDNSEGIKKYIETRDDSKIAMFKYLYNDRDNNPYVKVIKKNFSDLHTIVKQKRKELKEQGINLAIFLQRIEAEIFIEGTKNVIQKGCLTVHDSIFFKESLHKIVESCLTNSLRKHNIKKFNLVT